MNPEPDCPAARVSRAQITAPYDDPDALQALGRLCDVVTFEFENVPALSVEQLAEARALVAPGPDRPGRGSGPGGPEDLSERRRRSDRAYFAAVSTLHDLTTAIETLGLPALLKTRREGYDGKGQVWIRDAADAEAAFDAIGRRPAVLEAAAVFNRELSVIAARGRDGAVAVYPLGENIHANGVLKTTLAPAAVDAKTQGRAVEIAAAVLDGLDYVGVMGIELFDMGADSDGNPELLVNEVAPRVHNTGHWTQDGCVCDQFEQHIRAIVGWPLGPTEAHACIEMTNLLGDEVEEWRTLAAEPKARLHLYGKAEARACWQDG